MCVIERPWYNNAGLTIYHNLLQIIALIQQEHARGHDGTRYMLCSCLQVAAASDRSAELVPGAIRLNPVQTKIVPKGNKYT